MKVLDQLFKKSKGEEKNLTAAASAIVGLESKLAEKESEAKGLRETQAELYQSMALGENSPKKISKVTTDLEGVLMEIAGLVSVIGAARDEALELAEMEIQDSIATNSDLQEQMTQETTAENKKLIVALRGLLAAIFKIHGVKGFIPKDDSLRFNIATDKMTDKDIAKANKKLEAFYEKTVTGPHFTAEQIRKMVEETAKTDPIKAVEKALQGARNSSTQSESKKAA